MNAQPDFTPSDAAALRWLEQRARSLRSRGLTHYRAHDDDEAMRLLDEADATWQMARVVRADNQQRSATP